MYITELAYYLIRNSKFHVCTLMEEMNVFTFYGIKDVRYMQIDIRKILTGYRKVRELHQKI